MIKCYHVRRVELVVLSDPTLYYDGPVISPLIATIDSDKENLNDIWDCCNNSCWWEYKNYRKMDNYKDKFKVKFTKDYMGYCNSDLIVEMNNLFYVAKSIGWHTTRTFEDAVNYCINHAYWVQLASKDYQHPTGLEHTIEELRAIKADYKTKGIKAELYRYR